MDGPILEGYTEAGIGEDTPMIDLTSDIEINFTLWKINVSLETDSSNYNKGDTIEVDVTVENNEIYKIENWEVGTDMCFWNETYWECIEDYYPVNISSGEKKSFLLYLEIPENIVYGNWNLWGWIWTDETEFESSKGPLQGEMGKEEGKEINIVIKTGYVLSGYVFDSAGIPLANVPVELEDENWTMQEGDTTNADGYFELTNLPQGLYGLYINDEEVTDCGVRNNVSSCQDINDRAACQNSYAEYFYPYCNLAEGEYGYFPCFWGDVGWGEGCYSSCDHCVFGVNQSILEDYTGAGIGEDSPMLNLTSDIQINFTLWKINVSFETNTSEYNNGDTIEVNITVENNEIYKIENWEVGAELYFGGNWDWIDEDYYLVNVSSYGTESFLVYLQIPENNTYDYLYIESFIWTDEEEFKSSKGLLQGELWQWQEEEIFIGEKTKFNFSLSEGWNLVSIPLVLTNNILPAPLESIEGNYTGGYIYIGGVWRQYLAGEPPSYDKYIDPTMGFWINMINDDTLVVEGYELDSVGFDLNEDWNLVGYPSLNEIDINESPLKNYIIFTYINNSWLSYIPNRPFNSLQTLKPGYGYWVKK